VLADPAVAETVARRFLADHLHLLAPGAAIGDFVQVSNQVGGSGDTRSVGFVQKHNGMRVLGGAIGFTFKHDHLVMVGSTALPGVAVPALARRMPAADAGVAARIWLHGDGHVVTPRDTSELVIMPVVRPKLRGRHDISFRLAEQIVVDANDGPGRWNVWVDANDATPIARQSTIMFASGKVMYDVSERWPGGTRSAQPSMYAAHTVNGTASPATVDGTVSWGSGSATISPKLTGAYCGISNAAGSVASTSLTLMDGGSVTWNAASSETQDAQLSTYYHVNKVKQFARTKLDPNLGYINQRISATVNESGTCNAYSTGDDIHFLRKSSNCENTGRLADVVYHEFGHSLHANAIIEGVGQWDGALSEGLGDILAMLMTNDSGMGRGFFNSNAPMRELNTATNKTWQQHTTGEVHDDGEIIGQTMWDTMVALKAKLGDAAGHQKTAEIFYSIMQRASDIPSSYAEALVADDDDGNIANGTPNQCELNSQFKLHGLASGTVTAGVSTPVRNNFTVSLEAKDTGNPACPGPNIQTAVVTWKPRGGGEGGTVNLTKAGDTYSGDIPTQPEGTVVQYKVVVTLAGGSKVEYPNNPADPFYEFYVGGVTPIWCASFEQGASDWTHGGTPDEWEAAAPGGLSNDPKMAHGGSAVFGYDLTKDGAYSKDTMMFAESPEIDLQGNTEVRLQYYRWLNVEDGFYDKAKLLVNGTEVWTNFASASEPQNSGVNHLDKEWRFQDVDLADFAADGKVKLRFEMTTDQGLQFGGWTMDDVCIVKKGADPTPSCGNGTVDEGESCDDGNRVDGDGCSATCSDENGGGPGGGPGDGIETGCCSSGSGPAGALGLTFLTLGLVLRRRRRN
jgi:cysteine-rich repeat protein